MIELTNSRGPLFKNTMLFFNSYVPINKWDWMAEIPSTIDYISMENLMSRGEFVNLKTAYIANKIVTDDDIQKMCEKVPSLKMLIIKSIKRNVGINSEKFCPNVNTVVIASALDTREIELECIYNLFPNLEFLYIYRCANHVSNTFEFKKLKVLSIAILDTPNLLNQIVAPNLIELDVYKINGFKGEFLSLISNPSLVSLRIDSVLYDDDLLEKNDNLRRLQYYGEQIMFTEKTISYLNKSKIIDLILPCNAFNDVQVAKLKMNYLKCIGVCSTDYSLEQYITKYNDMLNIYGNLNKHQAAILRSQTLFANFNIFDFTNSEWNKFFDLKSVYNSITISNEIVKSTPEEGNWPSFLIGNKTRRVIYMNNELKINISCNSVRTIKDYVSNIVMKLEQKVRLLHLTIRGTCININTLKMNFNGLNIPEIKYTFEPYDL